MPKVVPSQVVTLIDDTFPSAQFGEDGRPRAEYAPLLGAIVMLARDIPNELIQLSGNDYSEFVVGLAGLDSMVRTWLERGSGVTVPWKSKNGSFIALVRRALSQCPDEVPAPSTVELAFISDPDFRDNVRTDISSANSALHNGEWKGATVLAGSTSEALLLWSIHDLKTDTERNSAVSALLEAGTLVKKPNNNLEYWNLHEYIEVALELSLISQSTAEQVRLAKNFRNLIHPGRALRLGQSCDRGTALSAIASVEHIVRDLAS